MATRNGTTYTVFCAGNGCQFLREGLGKRHAAREATAHHCLNPDTHINENKPAEVPYVDVSVIHEYGLSQKLSNSVRVF